MKTLPVLPNRNRFSILVVILLFGLKPFYQELNPMSVFAKESIACNDTDKPILEIILGTCTPARFDSLTGGCAGFFKLNVKATDNETPSDQIKLEYKIDLYYDNIGIYNGYDIQVGPLSIEDYKKGIIPLHRHNPFAVDSNQTELADGTYPIGLHKICWFGTDSCGNVGAICQLFEIVDCQSPIFNAPYKIHHFKIPISRCIEINANQLKFDASDNCTPKNNLRYSFSDQLMDTVISYCCDDFLRSEDCYTDFFNQALFVIDESGNYDYMPVGILIEDVFQLCCDLIPRSSIEGKILISSNGRDSISGPWVDVQCINQHNIKIAYDWARPSYYLGLHDFGSYTLKGVKYGDPYQHVSGWDLIKIQQHLNGQELFTNRFQNFAADALPNDTINQADLNRIQKLILHAIDSMESSKDWYCIPVRYNDTLFTGFKDSVNFKMGGNIKRSIDFRLVKTGDVNDFSMPEHYTPPPFVPDQLIFTYKDQTYQSNELITIDFNVKEFKNKFGIQGTIQFDTNRLEFFKVGNFKLIGMSDASFSNRYAQDGYLTFCWYDPSGEGISMQDTAEIFSLTFKTKSYGDLCDALQMNSSITALEAYTKNSILTNINILCEPITSNGIVEKTKLQVWPNPFTNQLYIISSKDVKPLKIQLFNLNGSCQFEHVIPNPTNQTVLNLATLPCGMYLIKLQNSEKTFVCKIVKNY